MINRVATGLLAAAALAVAVGYTPAAFADPPGSPNQRQAAEAPASAADEGTAAETTNRHQPMVLGGDYVVGRYLIPLVIAVAAAFALVLAVVLPRDEDGGAETSQPSAARTS